MPVFVGMKHWRPRIAEAVEAALEAGATRIVGLVLAPHYSRLSVGGYRDRLEDALAGRAELVFVESWHDTRRSSTCSPSGCAAPRRRSSSPRTRCQNGSSTRGIPTASSCSRPRGSWPSGRASTRWSFAFQSASATGEPWLGPDVLEELDRLKSEESERVLAVPVGFVSDHLEILWDLDVEARERAAELGLELERIQSLNDDPAFVEALAELVRQAFQYPRRR